MEVSARKDNIVDMHGSGQKAAVTLRRLQRKIASGEWPVNSLIPKDGALMAELGVGKSTLREAVRSLASTGMLEPVKGIGTFVRSRTPVSAVVSDFVGAYPEPEILEYRRSLEVEAARIAALNRSDDQLEALRRSCERGTANDSGDRAGVAGEVPGSFHHLVFECAGNGLLTGIYTAVMATVRRMVFEGRFQQAPDHELRHRDHSAILNAIESRDPVRAAQAMALHVERDLVMGGESRDTCSEAERSVSRRS